MPRVANPAADPTESQINFLGQLYEQTKNAMLVGSSGPTYVEWCEQIRRQGQWTRGTISETIDAMISRRDAQRRAAAASRAVPIDYTPGPASSPEPVPASLREPWIDGHHLIDGCIYHVTTPRSRRRWTRPDDRDVFMLDLERRTATGRAQWRTVGFYRPTSTHRPYSGRVRNESFTVDTLVTPERLAEFGAAHGFCGICGRTLTDPHSVERGIGPVCWTRVQGYREVIEAAQRPETPVTPAVYLDGGDVTYRIMRAGASEVDNHYAIFTEVFAANHPIGS